jgi:hypothetical protein
MGRLDRPCGIHEAPMVIKRVNPISVAKMSGLLGALLGLVIGAFVSLAMMLWAGRPASAAVDAAVPRFAGMFVGVGAIVALPIFYGVFMFIVGLIQAALYNVAARWVGGVEIDVA